LQLASPRLPLIGTRTWSIDSYFMYNSGSSGALLSPATNVLKNRHIVVFNHHLAPGGRLHPSEESKSSGPVSRVCPASSRALRTAGRPTNRSYFPRGNSASGDVGRPRRESASCWVPMRCMSSGSRGRSGARPAGMGIRSSSPEGRVRRVELAQARNLELVKHWRREHVAERSTEMPMRRREPLVRAVQHSVPLHCGSACELGDHGSTEGSSAPRGAHAATAAARSRCPGAPGSEVALRRGCGGGRCAWGSGPCGGKTARATGRVIPSGKGEPGR